LASLVTAVLFLLALFFRPLVEMVGGGVELESGVILRPIPAPILILVGSMMMRGVKEIAWDEPDEAIPAFLVILGMPLTFSIADGLALGFISWPLLKLLSGKRREIPGLLLVLAVLLALVFALKARLSS
jgi:AGZA family xanthine/uracil permease-like MFS transporter